MATPSNHSDQNAAGGQPGRQPAVLYAADFKLVQDCLRQDNQAWTRLIAEFRQVCLAIARQNGQGDAFDDLFSCFIVKLAGSADCGRPVLARYDGRASLKTYLSVVFLHMVLDAHRTARRQAGRVDSERPIEDYQDTIADRAAADQADQAEKVETLHAALATLSAQDRRVLTLYYDNEFTLKHIAALFRCSEATVSRKIKALVGRLRDLMGHPS